MSTRLYSSTLALGATLLLPSSLLHADGTGTKADPYTNGPTTFDVTEVMNGGGKYYYLNNQAIFTAGATIGLNTPGNTLSVYPPGMVLGANDVVGASAASTGNVFELMCGDVSNKGAMLLEDHSLTIGANGSSLNSFYCSSVSAMVMGDFTVGSGSATNQAVVGDLESLGAPGQVQISGALVVGNGGDGNQFAIQNASTVTASGGAAVGNGSGGNQLSLSGGSTLTVGSLAAAFDFTLGASGNGNQVAASDSSSSLKVFGDVYVGTGSGSGNLLACPLEAWGLSVGTGTGGSNLVILPSVSLSGGIRIGASNRNTVIFASTGSVSAAPAIVGNGGSLNRFVLGKTSHDPAHALSRTSMTCAEVLTVGANGGSNNSASVINGAILRISTNAQFNQGGGTGNLIRLADGILAFHGDKPDMAASLIADGTLQVWDDSGAQGLWRSATAADLHSHYYADNAAAFAGTNDLNVVELYDWTPDAWYNGMQYSGLDIDTARATAHAIWPSGWWPAIDEVYDFIKRGNTYSGANQWSQFGTNCDALNNWAGLRFTAMTNTQSGNTATGIFFPALNLSNANELAFFLGATNNATVYQGNTFAAGFAGTTFYFGDGTPVVQTGTVLGATDLGGWTLIEGGYNYVTDTGSNVLFAEILTQPTGGNYSLGASVTLTVSALSETTLSYQWYNASGPISGAQSASYTIPSLTAANAGTYWVNLTNSAGVVSSNHVSVGAIQSIFPTTTTLGWKWIPIGWIHDGYFPWFYNWDHNAWFYVYGGLTANPNGFWVYFQKLENSTKGYGYMTPTGWYCQVNGEWTWLKYSDPIPDAMPDGYLEIGAGSFQMGSPVTETGRSTGEVQHKVTLTHAFYMQDTEVTWTQWNTVRTWALAHGYTDLATGANGKSGDASGTHPVTKVSWHDAVKWLNARSEMEGYTPCYRVGGAVYRTGISDEVTCNWRVQGYRLPTEAEWEYACRAGSTGAFYNGAATPDAIAWYGIDSSGNTHPAAAKAANAWGLYDMSGNVWEWVWDWYDTLSASAVTDPAGPAAGSARIIRGGSWYNEAAQCRSAFRYSNARPYDRFDNVGFRPVLGE